MAKHSMDIPVYRMVLDRLPFVADTLTNEELISRFTAEIMSELEPCFRIAEQVSPSNDDRIGEEDYYDVKQRSLIADLVAVYVLQRNAASLLFPMEGSTTTTNTNTYIKTAKAGSAEVEYGQLDATKTLTRLDLSTLMDRLMKSAMRRGIAMGCIIDICEDCALSVEAINYGMPPMRIIGGCSGCGGSNRTQTAERG